MSFIPSRAILDAVESGLELEMGCPASPNLDKVKLYTNDITPSPDNVAADFDLATFTGSTPKDMPDEADAVTYNDPLSGDRIIDVPLPEGGLLFKCTAAPVSPETIYGYIVTTSAGVYKGGERFVDPVIITDVDDAVDIDEIATPIANIAELL